MRTLICLLGGFLICYEHLEKRLSIIAPILFYFIIFFSFGFFFSYMLFKNPNSNIWQINELTGLVLLSVFVDWRSFIVLFVLSIITAFYFAATEPLAYYQHLFIIFGSYSSPIICLLIFAEKRKNLREERETYHARIRELNELLELKVKERTEVLQEALTVKTEFLNNMSHEIRTPLHGFTCISQGLVESWKALTEEKKYKYVTDIAASANRLYELVSNILDLSKLNANKMHIKCEQISINKIFLDLIKECYTLYLNKKNINIIYSPTEDYIIKADIDKIKQVFRNLLINAIKFTPEEGKIKIILVLDGGFIHVMIRDTGVGIPEADLENIFVPFTQSSRTKTAGGGTGLGLSISEKIVKMHHGMIWAENNKDLGATFHVLLPLQSE